MQQKSIAPEDGWKLTSRLTVNLGLRYEYPQTYREQRGHQAEWYTTGALSAGNTASVYLIPTQSQGVALGSVFPTLLAKDNVSLKYTGDPYLVHQDKLNFAPRIGIAYQLSGGTILRAGYGRFYGGLENTGYDSNMGGNLPFLFQSAYIANARRGCMPNDCPTNGLALESGFSSQLAAGLINSIQSPTLLGMDPVVRTPNGENYNVTAEYGITANMVFNLAYVGSRSRHLIVLTNPNAPLALETHGADPSLEQPLRDFGSAVWVSYSGVSNYNSLQAKLERRFAQGLNFLATYTWSHSLDDAPTPLGSNGDNGFPNTNIQPARDQYSNSPFDTRQRFTFNTNYDLPFGPQRRFALQSTIANHLAVGWSASLTFVAQTAIHFP
jgi:hypothetical protein